MAPAIRERQRDISTLAATLNRPRQVAPKLDELRVALEQRAANWRETLSAEPVVARALLRQLMEPLEWADPTVEAPGFTEWVASLTPALFEGLAHVPVLASPTGSSGQEHDVPLEGTIRPAA